MRNIRHRWAVLAIVGVACLAASAAYAAIPDGNGVIHGCYNASSNPSGQLRVIDTAVGGKCSKNEKALDFNQTGPRGPVGPQGATGAQGPTGAQGAVGPLGPTGPVGSTGPAGQQGPAGLKGDKGDPGAPGTSTATFAFADPVDLTDTLTKVASKNLPEGSWAVVATVNMRSFFFFLTPDQITDAGCQLRNGADVIGSATDRRLIPEDEVVKRSLSLNGGAQIGSGGGEVSLWCFSQGPTDRLLDAQVMLIQVGGFS